jgi:hypothetical protein
MMQGTLQNMIKATTLAEGTFLFACEAHTEQTKISDIITITIIQFNSIPVFYVQT